MRSPGYWVNEESGVLKPVVLKYLNAHELDEDEVTIMRAYLRQWINADFLPTIELDDLRISVNSIKTHDDVRRWLQRAFEQGVDPL